MNKPTAGRTGVKSLSRFVSRYACLHAGLAVVLALLMPVGARVSDAATIYVDASNTGPHTNGVAWTSAWTTISQGMLDLSNQNAIAQGGYSVVVTSGTYSASPAYYNDYASGTPTQPNSLVATGTVLYPAAATPVFDCSNFVFDGFSMIRNGNRLVVGGASVDNLVIQNCTIGGNEALSYDRGGLAVTWPVTNVVFRRCTVLGAQASGLWTYRPVTIEHCNFIGMGDGGIWLLGGSSGTVIRDCIFAGNGLAGLRVDGATRVLASNNCFFGNGEGNVFFTGVGKRWESASEINSCTQYASVFVNNIVTNPGFSALSRGWNDAVLYSNSPCLDAGTAGTDIGRHENPATVATSANTYYVKTNGDDSADGLTLGTAWATLPKATSVAVAGDTVVVQAGLYTNAVTITNGGSGPLTVRYRAPDGAAISNRLTLDRVGGVSMSGFEVMGTLTVTSSFGNVVSTGSVHHAVGDGIRLFYAPGNLLDSLAIHHNTGNGIYDRERSCALISRCRIYNNGGHGMLLGGASSTMMPGALRMWNANVFNNASNGVRMADAEYNLTKHEIVNSDLVGNGAQGLWIDDDTSAGFTLVNSIVADNAGGVWENGAGGDAVVSNCCFHANAGTNFFDEGVTVRDIAADINAVAGCVSNKVANPNFLPASGLAEFFLSSASPCLDSGTPVPFLATDLYGRPRIFHRQVDIGSCEFQVFGTFVILR